MEFTGFHRPIRRRVELKSDDSVSTFLRRSSLCIRFRLYSVYMSDHRFFTRMVMKITFPSSKANYTIEFECSILKKNLILAVINR